VLEVGTLPKVQQEALHMKQRDDHKDGGITEAQVGHNVKAVELALFIFQSLKMLLIILW
jgi:hypothetical protein